MTEHKWTFEPDTANEFIISRIDYEWYCLRGSVCRFMSISNEVNEFANASLIEEIASRGGLVRDVLAERDQLKARVAELESGNTIRFVVDTEDALKAVSDVIDDNARLRGEIDRLKAKIVDWRATIVAIQKSINSWKSIPTK